MFVRATLKVMIGMTAAMAMIGCSSLGGRFGLGSATAGATEQVAAQGVEHAASGNQAQQASYDSGAGRQIGQAAGQELFGKTPYLGSALGGVVGSQTEKS